MRRSHWRRTTATSLVLALLAGLTACGRTERTDPANQPLAKVTVLTGFGLIGQDAYLYLAREKGFFRDAGLEVEIQAGKGTAGNLQVLLAGKATFATVDLTGALIAYGNKMTGFTTVAAVYQRSVSTITALPGSGISRPADLAGKTIGYQPGGVNHTLFPTYARLSGIDPATVRWRQVSPAQIRPLLAAGKLDAITETVIGTPGVEAAASGRKAVVLPYSDVITDLFGNVIVTTTSIATGNPDLVRRFRNAALKALVYAIDHPDEAGEVFAAQQENYPARTATAETALMASYVRADGRDQVGALNPARVMRCIALLQGVGVIPVGIQPADVVSFDLATPFADTRR